MTTIHPKSTQGDLHAPEEKQATIPLLPKLKSSSKEHGKELSSASDPRFPQALLKEKFPLMLPESRGQFMELCIRRKHYSTFRMQSPNLLFRRKCDYYGCHESCIYGRWCHFLMDEEDEKTAESLWKKIIDEKFKSSKKSGHHRKKRSGGRKK